MREADDIVALAGVLETKQIEQFRTGKITKPTIHALMHPSKFMGFASMTIMGADLMDSIFYHYYRKLGVEFRENRKISAMVKQVPRLQRQAS